MMTVKFGTLEIPLIAALKLTQSYEPIGAESIFRTISGLGIKQTTYQKTRITTSGGGWLHPGLAAIDTKQQLVLACITPESLPCVFATRQATLPAARRSDAGHVPWGFALMADGQPVKTPAAMAGNVATLTAVTGAVAYVCYYLPQFTVWAFRPTTSGERESASYQWQLICEEV